MDYCIAVIIPSIRFDDEFRRSIDSVWEQTFTPHELIITIDRLTSETESEYKIKFEEISAYLDGKSKSKSIEYKLISVNENVGPGRGRNLAQKSCSDNIGWFAFLDADDYWVSDHLLSFVKWHRTKKLYKNIIYFDRYNSVKMPFNKLSLRKVLMSARLHTPCAIISRSDVLFCEHKHAEDFAYWTQLISKGYSGYCVDWNGAYGRKERFKGGGQSSELLKMSMRHIQFIVKNYMVHYPFASFFAIVYECIKLPTRFFRQY